MPYVPADIVRQVIERASDRCEYCHAPRIATGQSFHLEHIIPLAQGGTTELHNLAYACPHYNLHKSSRLDAVDPLTQARVRLFDPRTDRWSDHFKWDELYDYILPQTPMGRATASALDCNAPSQVNARRLWAILGLIP